ncbi:hypothetical protein HHK36_019599 [Tetracentron sinense]|uniref:Uncharacterized protein n=1 Tax=Tetracentron sinense TaxID=13715 RepID=A0A834YTZ2_TETSI|nr:hypothetical protein HHK36_019599 [Tetracentron sinense]
MDTLLRTHNKLEWLHPLHGFAVKKQSCELFKASKPQIQIWSRKSHQKWSRDGCVKVSSSDLLELVPEAMKENLEFDLSMYDPSKGLVVDLAVVGGGPAGLAVAQQFSEAGLSVCSNDPSPELIWPNNYVKEAHLNRPYGRVNRNQLKSKMMQKRILNGDKFHQAKVIKVIHEEFMSLLICNDGVTVKATVVLDATGFWRSLVQYDKPYNPGY